MMKAVGIGWSMLWRATLLGPVFLVFQVVVVATGIFRFAGPVWIATMVLGGEWRWTGFGLAGWIGSVGLWRWRRFRGMLERPSSW